LLSLAFYAMEWLTNWTLGVKQQSPRKRKLIENSTFIIVYFTALKYWLKMTYFKIYRSYWFLVENPFNELKKNLNNISLFYCRLYLRIKHDFMQKKKKYNITLTIQTRCLHGHYNQPKYLSLVQHWAANCQYFRRYRAVRGVYGTGEGGYGWTGEELLYI
jgi:hypothetical protein